jgi:hypothetical protein
MSSVVALLVVVASAELAVPAGASAAAAAASSWRSRAVVAPPGAASNPDAGLYGVTCTSAKDCVAGGAYEDSAGNGVPMVATESRGHWGRASEIRLPANAAADPHAEVNEVACWAARSCIAVGYYQDSLTSADQGFIATESNGSWRQAFAPALPANASATPAAWLYGAACWGRRSCVAVGSYLDSAGGDGLMAVSESGGKWRRATQIALPSGAPAKYGAEIASVACPAARSCVAVGFYYSSTETAEGLEVTEAKGKWHRAVEVKPPAGAQQSKGDYLVSVSCWSTSCLAIGAYPASGSKSMAASYVRGHWRRAVHVDVTPRGAGANADAGLDAVACTARGCTAVGDYLTKADALVAITMSESGGRWGKPSTISPPANTGSGIRRRSYLYALACSGSACTAVGYYYTATTIVAMAST